MPEIGVNIRRARLALGWTQGELASKIGYKSKSSIQKIEKGLTDIPQSKIVEFAHALGTTPAALMGLVDDETRARTDAIAGVVVRMRSDPRFHEAVMLLYNVDDDERLGKMVEVLGLLK